MTSRMDTGMSKCRECDLSYTSYRSYCEQNMVLPTQLMLAQNIPQLKGVSVHSKLLCELDSKEIKELEEEEEFLRRSAGIDLGHKNWSWLSVESAEVFTLAVPPYLLGPWIGGVISVAASVFHSYARKKTYEQLEAVDLRAIKIIADSRLLRVQIKIKDIEEVLPQINVAIEVLEIDIRNLNKQISWCTWITRKVINPKTLSQAERDLDEAKEQLQFLSEEMRQLKIAKAAFSVRYRTFLAGKKS